VGLAYFFGAPFDVGTYTLRLTVEQPATALAGLDQTLYARYELCYMERLGVDLLWLLTVLSGSPALLVGLLTGIGVYRHGWHRPTPLLESPIPTGP